MLRLFMIVSCLVVLSSPSIFAAEIGCSKTWEYKLIHMEDTDKPMAQTSKATDSASDLVAMLNRLGSQGWELASSNEIVMRSVAINSDVPTIWRAQFEPEAVLFKRVSKECQ